MCFFRARWRERDGGRGSIGMYGGVHGGGRAARAFRCGGGRPARRLCFGRTHTICFPGLSDHCAASSDIPARRELSAASPCAPRVLSAASPCARVRIHCAVLSLPDAGSVCRVALRAPVIACVPREGRILAGSQRVPCPPRHPARPPASSARPNPARRGFCPSASRALRRPRPRADYPCAPRVLPASSFCLRSAGRADIGRGTAPARPRPPRGLTQRAAGSARRVALRAAARVLRTALSLRAAGFVRPPRERRILAGSQRVPCPPRHPVRRRPRHPHSPIPPCRGFCPSAAGKADIGREPARAVPAASPCARPPASPVRPTPARRMPCPPASRALRRPRSPCGLSLRPPASPVRPNPAHRGFCPPRRPAPARVPRAAYPCAPPASARAASGCIRAMP